MGNAWIVPLVLFATARAVLQVYIAKYVSRKILFSVIRKAFSYRVIERRESQSESERIPSLSLGFLETQANFPIKQIISSKRYP